MSIELSVPAIFPHDFKSSYHDCTIPQSRCYLNKYRRNPSGSKKTFGAWLTFISSTEENVESKERDQERPKYWKGNILRLGSKTLMLVSWEKLIFRNNITHSNVLSIPPKLLSDSCCKWKLNTWLRRQRQEGSDTIILLSFKASSITRFRLSAHQDFSIHFGLSRTEMFDGGNIKITFTASRFPNCVITKRAAE